MPTMPTMPMLPNPLAIAQPAGKWVLISGSDAQEIHRLARETGYSPEEIANALLADHLLAFQLDPRTADLLQRHTVATGADPHELVRQALQRPRNAPSRTIDVAPRGKIRLPWGCSIGLVPLLVIGVLVVLFACCWISYMASLFGAAFTHPLT